MSLSLQSVPRKGRRTAGRVMDGEAVVFVPGKAEVRILNRVGTTVWELIDGKRPVEDIVKEICGKYDVENGTAKKDVLDFLQTLVEKELIEI
jgi:hypothetical protein